MAINIEALKALAIKSGATPGDLSSLTFAAAAYPSAILALIERVEAAERGAAFGEIAFRFVDRAGDYCKEDPAGRICDEFAEAMADEIDRQDAAMAKGKS
jgi:hypothetical protein